MKFQTVTNNLSCVPMTNPVRVDTPGTNLGFLSFQMTPKGVKGCNKILLSIEMSPKGQEKKVFTPMRSGTV